MEDKEIVREVLDGNLFRFEELIQQYENLVFHIIRKSLFKEDYQIVEDIAQEVFFSVFHSLSSYNPDYDFRNWIYTITLNKIRAYFKKEKKQNKIFYFFSKKDDSFEEKDLKEEKEIHFLIQNEIKKLPEKYRTIITLFYLKDLKIKDIKEILNLNENTIKTHLKRAKQLLEKNLKRKKLF